MLQKIVFLILFFFFWSGFHEKFHNIYSLIYIFFLFTQIYIFFSGNVTYFNDVWIYFYWKTRQKYCLTIISCSTCNIHTPSPHKTPFPPLFLSSSCFSFRHSFIIQWRNTGAPVSTDSFQKSYSQTRIIPNSTHTHTHTLVTPTSSLTSQHTECLPFNRGRKREEAAVKSHSSFFLFSCIVFAVRHLVEKKKG